MDWKDYYKDLAIPSNWVDVSYSNDVLPSFQTSASWDRASTDYSKGFHVFIDSYDESVRADNTEEVTGQREELMPRFSVSKEYGEGEVFNSNDFDEVLKFINQQIPLASQFDKHSDYCVAAIDYLDSQGIDTEDYKTLFCDILATNPAKRNWKIITSQLETKLITK
tara:strand:+ start:115 stop:612 length:498 start_codon:yes stop_codon:yes gene_type:complete